jgi:UDP-N-acetylmuramyl pentapeptide phosphotransferase/UDP-N-acetylglucosamine-1-phosphate transferase
MYNIYIYLFSSILIIQFYFKIANRFNIIDKPNQRSSHTILTIRGAGLVFPIIIFATLVFNIFTENAGVYLIKEPIQFWIALLVLSAISFYDDVKSLSPKFRMLIQIIAVASVVFSSNTINWQSLMALILIIGVINAYNFMDGINGITALYSLVAVITALIMLDLDYQLVIGSEIWWALGSALVVFSFYNVRKRARCFSGDVGAVSVAFILSYWIYGLVIANDNLIYILFLGVYGLDSVATIALRLYRKENILEAHRSHLYQLLANEKGWSHVRVSSIYALTQAVLNGLILYNSFLAIIFFIVIVLIYIVLRFRWAKK